MEDVTTRFINT